MTGNNVSKRF